MDSAKSKKVKDAEDSEEEAEVRREPDISNAGEIYTEFCYARFVCQREKLVNEELVRRCEDQTRLINDLRDQLFNMTTAA